MPFYNRVYNRAFNTRLQAMIEQTLRTKGENRIISGEELGRVMYGAHKDAVRETKGTCTRLSGALSWVTLASSSRSLAPARTPFRLSASVGIRRRPR